MSFVGRVRPSAAVTRQDEQAGKVSRRKAGRVMRNFSVIPDIVYRESIFRRGEK